MNEQGCVRKRGEDCSNNGGSKDGPVKRRSQRHDIAVPVSLRALVEEETYTPFPFKGQSRNISADGILVEIENLPEEKYKSLIRGRRTAWIQLDLPEADEKVVLTGKVVWYDYRVTSRGAFCLTGIAFENLREKDRNLLHRFLQRFESPQEPENG